MRLSVKGKRVLVTGTFSRLDTEDAEIALRRCGARLATEIGPQVDYVIAGDDAQLICERATALDVPVLTEHALLSIIGRAPKRRREDLFPSGANLLYTLEEDEAQSEEEVIPIRLPELCSDRVGHDEVEMRLRSTPFVTTRKFGETWGLKLSEFDMHWLGTLWCEGSPLCADTSSELAEHLYYYRFRSDGTPYANGERRFLGEEGFHASWLREVMGDRDEIPVVVETTTIASAPEHEVTWRPGTDGEMGGAVWILRLNAEHRFGHVHAFEHEELTLDLEAMTWRWAHYFTPYDGIM